MRHGSDGDGPYSRGTAFALWLACIVGFCGVHRFYLGRPGTGLLYLFTFGLFGIGQLVDLIRIPSLVAEENTKFAAFQALAEKRALSAMGYRALPPARTPGQPPRPPEVDAREALQMKLVKAAASHGGRLSVTQGVMATGKSFKEIETLLDEMAKSGYVGIGNDEKTGVVVYEFGELA